MNKEVKQTIISSVIIIAVGFVALLSFYLLVRREPFKVDKKREVVVNPKVETEVIEQERLENGKASRELSEFESFEKVKIYPSGLVTSSDLIIACEDKKKDSYTCNKELAKITRVLETKGEVKKAYLYIKAGVSREGSPIVPLTRFDSIWFFFSDTYNSGHLLRSGAILNRQTQEGLTELLFDLSSIPFTHLPYDDDRRPDKEPNILESLNKRGRHLIAAFVSTLGYGKLYELTIGYDGGSVKLVE